MLQRKLESIKSLSTSISNATRSGVDQFLMTIKDWGETQENLKRKIDEYKDILNRVSISSPEEVAISSQKEVEEKREFFMKAYVEGMGKVQETLVTKNQALSEKWDEFKYIQQKLEVRKVSLTDPQHPATSFPTGRLTLFKMQAKFISSYKDSTGTFLYSEFYTSLGTVVERLKQWEVDLQSKTGKNLLSPPEDHWWFQVMKDSTLLTGPAREEYLFDPQAGMSAEYTCIIVTMNHRV